MTVDERVVAALAPIGWLVVPNEKQADTTRYFAFNYNSIPVAFGSNRPTLERYLVQVHLICTRDYDTALMRGRVKRLLKAAGFTFPSVVNASDDVGQHYVFECEIARGVDADGEL